MKRRRYIPKTSYLQSKLTRLEHETAEQRRELHERNLALLEIRKAIEVSHQPANAGVEVGVKKRKRVRRLWSKLLW